MASNEHPEYPEWTRQRPDNRRPHFAPSYDVHIVSTSMPYGTSGWTGPDHWIRKGYDLRNLISMIYGFTATRVEFSTLDPSERYDIALVLPHREDEPSKLARIQKAIERDLQLSISRVAASRGVYVVTAPNGPGPELVSAGSPGGGMIGTSKLFSLPSGRSP